MKRKAIQEDQRKTCHGYSRVPEPHLLIMPTSSGDLEMHKSVQTDCYNSIPWVYGPLIQGESGDDDREVDL